MGKKSLKNELTLSFKQNKSIWIISFLFIANWILEIINGRFTLHDFQVSYDAARNLINGEPVYGISFGLSSGIYKYSPFTLLFILPYAFLPFFIAKTVQYFCIAAVAIFCVIYLERFIREIYFYREKIVDNKVLSFAILVVCIHLHREAHLGNWNVHLLLLAILSLRLMVRNKEYWAGIILAWIILMKPHFVILLPLLVMRKKIKTLGSVMAGFFIGLGFPSIFLGLNKTIELNLIWFRTLHKHNVSFLRDESCLQSILYNSFFKHVYPHPDLYFTSVVVLFVAILFLIFMICNFRDEKTDTHKISEKDIERKNFIFEYFLLLAILPSIVVTDTQHYLWSLPIIVFILSYMVYGAPNRNWLFYFTIASFLIYGGNIYDLWGRKISVWMENFGFIGIGNILIILSSLIWFSRFRTDHDSGSR